jgi:hypothetical protein
MSHYYQTTCRTEDDAIAAFHAVENVFDSIDDVTGYSRKRHAESLLWRFDDEPPIVERMLAALRDTNLFTEIHEIPEDLFWNARSYPV